jgi:hypothetical protein
MAIPHKTIDIIGATACAASLRFKAHDAYAVLGEDLNDLCALVVRLRAAVDATGESFEWSDRLTKILDEALQSNLSEK